MERILYTNSQVLCRINTPSAKKVKKDRKTPKKEKAKIIFWFIINNNNGVSAPNIIVMWFYISTKHALTPMYSSREKSPPLFLFL